MELEIDWRKGAIWHRWPSTPKPTAGHGRHKQSRSWGGRMSSKWQSNRYLHGAKGWQEGHQQS
eukprot:8943535-Prorocentrum_lima.AAC.1